VLAWLQAVDNANLQLASVSLGEIQAGIEITREQDAAIALVHGLTVVTHRQGLRRFRCGEPGRWQAPPPPWTQEELTLLAMSSGVGDWRYCPWHWKIFL
jgi:hypothetical protein